MSEIELLRRQVQRERAARREAETLIERKSLELYHAKVEAEVANRAKTEFLANVGHELRTPLNAIIGFTDMLIAGTAGPINPQQRDFLGDVSTAGKQLLTLVNQILEISKLEFGRRTLRLGPVDLRTGLEFCRERCAERAGLAGVALVCDVPDDLPAIEADESAVRSIVLNLLDNAIKFTPKGGTVRLAARGEADGVAISVHDTGIGIAPDNIHLVFQPFFQVESQHGRRFEGAGLGLAIVKALVDKHGGRLNLESALGHGATFRVYLPAAGPDAAAAATAS